MAEKAGGAYREIKRRIERSAVAGADETGCHVNGKKHWMYIWQNDGLTYLVPSEHRNYETIEREFPEGLPLAALVSDCLAAQLKTPAKRHQICVGAHLLRELKNFETGLGSPDREWSAGMKETIKDALELKGRIMNGRRLRLGA